MVKLLVRAGVSEVENRILYQGDVTGRYAIVPVDELVADHDATDEVLGFDTEPQIEESRTRQLLTCVRSSIRLGPDRTRSPSPELAAITV